MIASKVLISFHDKLACPRFKVDKGEIIKVTKAIANRPFFSLFQQKQLEKKGGAVNFPRPVGTYTNTF